jgi:hypothetical protein
VHRHLQLLHPLRLFKPSMPLLRLPLLAGRKRQVLRKLQPHQLKVVDGAQMVVATAGTQPAVNEVGGKPAQTCRNPQHQLPFNKHHNQHQLLMPGDNPSLKRHGVKLQAVSIWLLLHSQHHNLMPNLKEHGAHLPTPMIGMRHKMQHKLRLPKDRTMRSFKWAHLPLRLKLLHNKRNGRLQNQPGRWSQNKSKQEHGKHFLQAGKHLVQKQRLLHQRKWKPSRHRQIHFL